MNHQGHGLAYDHPVFNYPYAVSFKKVKTEREKQYENLTSPLYPEGMGETYDVVNFEKVKPADGRWNPTLVSSEGFFRDIPGLESIAEGCSGKRLGSLSLARQGNYFYWGYSIDPELLTDGAKRAFINALYYMHSKRGSLTVKYVCKTRETLHNYVYLNEAKDYKRGFNEHIYGMVLEDSLKDYEESAEGLKQWLAKHGDYLYSGRGERHQGTGKYERYGMRFEIDRDAEKLQTPNHDIQSLEKWIELASSDDNEAQDTALRCLNRYVHSSIAPKVDEGQPVDWKQWYSQYKDRIVFIESTGFWWQTDPRILEREQFEKRNAHASKSKASSEKVQR